MSGYPPCLSSISRCTMNFISRVKDSNILRNTWTQIASITIFCGFIIAWAGKPSLSQMALVIIAGVFLVWLIWSLFILCSSRFVTPMNSKGYRILDNIGCLLFLFWICMRFIPSLASTVTIIAVIVIWGACLFVAFRFRE